MPASDETQREDRQGIIAAMAQAANITPERFLEAVRRRVAKEAQTPDLILFLHTANRYGLDPLATPSEIALFVPKGGGIPKPYVTFDGWLRILFSHPNYISHRWTSVWSGGAPGKGTCDASTFYIKRKLKDGTVEEFEHTELLRECLNDGSEYSPWRKFPVRMLREKAAMQGTRFCFGLYVPDLDDLEQAEAMERARREGAASSGDGAGAAPVIRIPGAATVPERPAAPDVLALPESAGPEVIDFRGASVALGIVDVPVDPGPGGRAPEAPKAPKPRARRSKKVDDVPDAAPPADPPADGLFPATPGRSTPATLPSAPDFDPEESRRLDAQIAAAESKGDFDDLVL